MPDDLEPWGPALPVGTTFGRYRIEGRIGAGGMASVYEARHVDLDKRVALKVMHGESVRHEPAVGRFLQEARAAARLQHRHVVNVLDVGREGPLPYLVMEFLEGEPMSDLVDREAPLPVARVAALLLPVLSAVAAAHALGIVHRDLKPANVFLAQDEGSVRPVLLDFGISKTSGAYKGPALTLSGQLLGTPHYMSPEQVRESDVDARADQYALGVMMYESVTGVLPFRSEGSLFFLLAEIMLGSADPPSRFNPALPPSFENLVLKAMANRREDRFEDITALAAALLPFAAADAQRDWSARFSLEAPAAPPARTSVKNFTVARAQTLIDCRVSALPEPPAPPGPQRRPVTVTPRELAGLDALGGCSPSELDMFCLAVPAFLYPAGATLFSQGAAGDSCFILLSGEVEVVKLVGTARTVLNKLGAGALLGQIALVTSTPRSAAVVASKDAVVLELGRDIFRRLIDSRSEVGQRFQDQIAIAGIRQLRSATRQLSTLLEQRAVARAKGQVRPLDDAQAEGLERVQAAIGEWGIRLTSLPPPPRSTPPSRPDPPRSSGSREG